MVICFVLVTETEGKSTLKNLMMPEMSVTSLKKENFLS